MNQNNNDKKFLLKRKKKNFVRVAYKESIGQMMPKRHDKTSLF